MALDIYSLFSPRAIAAYWEEMYSNTLDYEGAKRFPVTKQASLDLKFIKGKNGLPVSLNPSTYDAEAAYGQRMSVSEIETEMPFFRQAYLLKESDRRRLATLASTGDPYAREVISRLYDDVGTLISGAAVVPERMIWQLLAPTTGQPGISIVANGVNYTYNYDPNSEYKTTNYIEKSGTDMWSDAEDSHPLTDLMTAMDTIETTYGRRPTIAYMSRKTFNYLMSSAEVRSAILAQNATANIFMTETVVRTVLQSTLGLSVIIYNKQYKDEKGVTQLFLPDGMVVLTPDGPLGRTHYSMTPEEIGAPNAGPTNASVSIVNTGVAITAEHKAHPVVSRVIVSEIVLPSFESMDYVATLKVANP